MKIFRLYNLKETRSRMMAARGWTSRHCVVQYVLSFKYIRLIDFRDLLLI